MKVKFNVTTMFEGTVYPKGKEAVIDEKASVALKGDYTPVKGQVESKVENQDAGLKNPPKDRQIKRGRKNKPSVV